MRVRPSSGDARSPQVHHIYCMSRRIPTLAALLLGAAQALTAQQAEAARRDTTAVVTGVVFDSLAGAPLPGAIVQLVSVDRAAPFARALVANDSGFFSFDSVPRGAYALGFFGSVLDSLGFEPVLTAVLVERDSVVRADLGVPSALRLREMLCTSETTTEVRGLVIGRVRDAFSFAPIIGAAVRGSWFEVSIDAEGIRSGQRNRDTDAQTSGWYALCDLPASGTMMISAANASDSTDMIPVEVPPTGLLRRDLYIGASSLGPIAAVPDVDDTGDGLPPRRTGPGTLSGRVVTAQGDQPLALARASIANGIESVSNARGEWTLARAPAGTRLLDVRALGYFPMRVPVDVIEGAPSVRVALPSLKSVLDSVRIVAERNRSANLRGFDDRRRTEPLGRFLTPPDLFKRPSNFIADVIASVPGVSLERNADGTSRLGMRPLLGRGRCSPSIHIDGVELRELSIEDLNGFARKGDVQGIEVYPSGHVPGQFSRFDTAGMYGCGAIVIWTK